MAEMYWNDAWKIGIDSIDDQHKRWIELFNQLYNDGEGIKPGEESIAKRVLSEFMAYGVYHFSTEEELFKQHGYPDMVNHVQQHGVFNKKIAEFYMALEKGKADAIAEMVDFLGDWLINHIMHADKSYVPFLKTKGVK